ncbi:TolC family protein [Paludisphaera rhizosphaerae]|uniref:TolC family protein n=1 Tax=Paludisphaera rhizosphaerae TaxID=2711216 RepID=UPI00197FBD8F|nr:TolC family protein [Paludisphaera rhizosphaerae]
MLTSRRPLLVGLALLGATAFAAAPSTRAEDLNDAWASALGVNQKLRAEQTNSMAAGVSVAAERAARFPTIHSTTGAAYFGQSPRFTTTLATPASATPTPISSPLLGANQSWLPISFTMATHPLYTSGRIQGAIDAASSQAGAQHAVEFRTALDLKLAVAEAYVDVLRGQRRLQVARSNVAQLGSFDRDVNNRVEQGVATRNDQLAADVALSNARLREVQAVTALDISWAVYNRYLCRPAYVNVELVELSTDPTYPVEGDPVAVAMSRGARGPSPEVDALVHQALRSRPELAELAHQGQSLEAKARVASSANKPQVSVGAGLLYAGSSSLNPQTNFLGTAFVDWNIFDGGAARRRSTAYELQHAAVSRQRADAADDIALQVHVQWSRLQEAKVSLGVAQHSVRQAEENIRVVLNRYKEQVSTYTEVLDAETRRLESLTRYYDAFYDKSLAEFRLHRAVGDL